MKINLWMALVVIAGISTAWAADTKQIEQQLREIDTEWSRAAAAKDVDKVVAAYSDGAIVLPPNAPAVTTREAIRKTWADLLGSVNSISWKPDRIEVAASGDMAYITGSYEMAMKDASGSITTDRGKYLAVFEKQSDGSWKCGADMFSSDLPAAGPAK